MVSCFAIGDPPSLMGESVEDQVNRTPFQESIVGSPPEHTLLGDLSSGIESSGWIGIDEG